MARFRVSVETDKIGSSCSRVFEVDDEDLEDWDEDERARVIWQQAEEEAREMISVTWEALS